MKKIILLLTAFALCLLVGCGAKTVEIDGDYVVITVDIKHVDEGATLRDYMDYLARHEDLVFEMQDGMVKNINGAKEGNNRYWMLYTNDTEYALGGFGECVYEGVKYPSASFGAEEIVVKDGCVYIWYLQAF